MKRFILLSIIIGVAVVSNAQNVGIGNTTPSEKLHVVGGNIKIGSSSWINSANSSFLKIGDGNYITIGEEEGDDMLTIRAKELIIRPSVSHNTIPVSIQGSSYYSQFMLGTNEDTYIRGGKASSNVIIGYQGSRVGIGMDNPRAALEQNGVVGTTAAIFGGEGSGISLQRNWPAIGFNYWYDGTNRSIGAGWASQLALSQTDGSLNYYTFNDNSASIGNQNMGASSNQFNISRKGDVAINGNMVINNANAGPALKIHNNVNLPNNYSGIRFETDASGGGVYPWNIQGGYVFGFYYNGAILSYISPTDGSYNNFSDMKLKKNVSNFSNNLLAKLTMLRPVNYLMKAEKDTDKKHFGFISQEVEKIFPEVVSENNGIKMMNYSGLIPILTKGIQEQQVQIEKMQIDNGDLKKMVQILSAKLESMQKQIETIVPIQKQTSTSAANK